MQRSSVIATVVAAGAILVAGSVASVAVINAASSTQPKPRTMSLAEPQPTPAVEDVSVIVAAPASSAPASSAPATPLAELSEEPLPELPEVTAKAEAQAQAAPAAPIQPKSVTTKKPSKKPQAKATKKPVNRPSASASASPSAESQQPSAQPEISQERAVQIVLNATNGGVVKNADKEEHGGYDSWAIRVLRHDGSVITGFVDRRSGVAFDWVVNQEAPTPTSNSGSGSSSSDDDHDDDDDKHEDDHEDEYDDD